MRIGKSLLEIGMNVGANGIFAGVLSLAVGAILYLCNNWLNVTSWLNSYWHNVLVSAVIIIPIMVAALVEEQKGLKANLPAQKL